MATIRIPVDITPESAAETLRVNEQLRGDLTAARFTIDALRGEAAFLRVRDAQRMAENERLTTQLAAAKGRLRSVGRERAALREVLRQAGQILDRELSLPALTTETD